MRIKVVGKNGRYRKRFSLETEDWITLIVVILVLGLVILNLILWQ